MAATRVINTYKDFQRFGIFLYSTSYVGSYRAIKQYSEPMGPIFYLDIRDCIVQIPEIYIFLYSVILILRL